MNAGLFIFLALLAWGGHSPSLGVCACVRVKV